ncbi:hypothetical protein V8C26DRAFT_400189 [Trichoderma gracile]
MANCVLPILMFWSGVFVDRARGDGSPPQLPVSHEAKRPTRGSSTDDVIMQRYGEASRENHWTGELEDFFFA